LCHKTSRKTLEVLHHHNIEVQIENLGTMLSNIGNQVEAKVPSFFVTIKKKYIFKAIFEVMNIVHGYNSR